MTRLRFRPLNASRSVIFAAFLCVVSWPLHADGLQDAQRLLKQGQFQQALDQTEQLLAAKPKDAQARFLKGLALTELGRQNDAIAVFTQLTEDYPELPEPYNNLAVIYAQMRQYDKAKTALEMAIRTHPSYATAHENLGDIYARLASQAYDKALQLDSSNTAAQNKLSMIRDLVGGSARPGVARSTATAVASGPAAAPAKAAPAAAAVTSAPAAAPKAEQAPRPAPAVEKPAPAAEKPAPAAEKSAVAKTPEAVKPEPAGDDDREIEAAVRNWAGAWARKDVKGYLEAYSRDFQTPNSQPRSVWETERRQRIAKPGPISVGVDGLRVARAGSDRAVVRFRQHYRSGALNISSGKTLVLVRRDGRWMIQQERVGG